ncbi:TonB-dependent siderophore receptor [Thalassotalea sp. 1_MG-2023]|uniref:TonB-dependent siderophore receptor n=1 Tax=Thalassotalea sp. 1_MG-2023 TaxID=3062680 RepID=UPI0026E3F418|nr:TonB-dependent siderophore receptor [Thalassotalea sp. 1_MG-2023]MDO6428229.1 TonB-dependent siderophore receptor [Thalassotalea sp. 1_MG-2023]
MSSLLYPLYSEAETSKPDLEVIEITADRNNSFNAQYVQAGTFNNAHFLDTPLTTTILTKDLLDSQLTYSLADAMRNTAGVSAAQINSTIYSNLSIRGIRLNNTTNYRLNGLLPIANYIQVPMENKYRVEVLKGAAGLYYGFGAPAGIVNMVTERAYKDHVEGTVFANQLGTLGGTIDISTIFNNAGLRVNLTTADEDIGLMRTSGKRDFASVGYHWDVSDQFRIEFDGEYITREITEPTQYYLLANDDGSVTLPPLLDTDIHHGADWFKATTDAYNLLFQTQYQILPQLQLNVSLGKAYAEATRRYSAFYGYDISSGTGGTVSLSTFPDTEYDNQTFDIKLAGGFALNQTENQWVIGFSQRNNESIIPEKEKQGAWQQHLYNPSNIEPLPKPKRTIKNTIETQDKGFYAQLRTVLNTQWQTTLGYRYADYQNNNDSSNYSETQGTISASVMYKPQDNLSFYTSYIEGLEEGGIAQGIAKNAGEVLPAALSEQYEYGVKYETPEQLLFTLAYFDIDRVSAFIHPDTELYVQDGRANYSGVELSMVGSLSDNWSISSNATYIDARQKRTSSEALTNKTIENTPNKTASVYLQYQVPNVDSLQLSVGGFYTASRYIDALNTTSAGGYTLFDLGAKYAVNIAGYNFKLGLYAQNVMDKAYWAATGSRLLAQGHPRTIKFEIKTLF